MDPPGRRGRTPGKPVPRRQVATPESRRVATEVVPGKIRYRWLRPGSHAREPGSPTDRSGGKLARGFPLPPVCTYRLPGGARALQLPPRESDGARESPDKPE